MTADLPPPPPSWAWKVEAALAAPQPLAVGAEVTLPERPTTPLFASVGWFRLGFGQPEKTIEAFTFEVGARWFAGRADDGRLAGFYVSGAVGWHRFAVSADLSSIQVSEEPLASRGTLSVNALFVAPSAGYRFRLGESWEAAFELGLRIPLVPGGGVSFEGDTSPATGVATGVAMRRIASLVVPEATLFRVSWRIP